MRLGLTLPPHASGPRHAALDSDIERAVQVAAAAEQAGFSTIYFNERHLDPDQGYSNPFAVAAAASGSVKTAWLAVRPLLPLHHPLRLVEQANLLAVLTRGRYLTVLADDDAAEPCARFGLPAPRNGQVDELIDAAAQAWGHEYQDEDDAPPLQFATALYASRMAGRIMPTTYRGQPPLLARAAMTPDAVAAAARRGWAVQLGPVGPETTRALVAGYREALAAAGHSADTTQRCLDWLVGSVTIRSADAPQATAAAITAFEAAGVAELRLDLAPGVVFQDLVTHILPLARPVPARSI